MNVEIIEMAKEVRGNGLDWYGDAHWASWLNLEARVMETFGYELTEEDGEELKIIFNAGDAADTPSTKKTKLATMKSESTLSSRESEYQAGRECAKWGMVNGHSLSQKPLELQEKARASVTSAPKVKASGDDIFGEIIHACTREQALEDGVLFDVSSVAKEAGIKWPVALTAAVHAIIKDIPPSRAGIQDYDGRLWDVLYMAHFALKRGGTSTTYQLVLDRMEERESYNWRKKQTVGRRVLVRNIWLKIVSGPIGPHDPRPCLTIMLTTED